MDYENFDYSTRCRALLFCSIRRFGILMSLDDFLNLFHFFRSEMIVRGFYREEDFSTLISFQVKNGVTIIYESPKMLLDLRTVAGSVRTICDYNRLLNSVGRHDIELISGLTTEFIDFFANKDIMMRVQ